MAVPAPPICADSQACAHNFEDQTSQWAHREIQKSMQMSTANTAERNPMAVMAVPDPALGSNLRACVHEMGVSPEDLPLRAMLEEFEERAAIMEFDGGLSRQDAEHEALAVISRYRLH
jgi:hypothetical protein